MCISVSVNLHIRNYANTFLHLWLPVGSCSLSLHSRFHGVISSVWGNIHSLVWDSASISFPTVTGCTIFVVHLCEGKEAEQLVRFIWDLYDMSHSFARKLWVVSSCSKSFVWIVPSALREELKLLLFNILDWWHKTTHLHSWLWRHQTVNSGSRAHYKFSLPFLAILFCPSAFPCLKRVARLISQTAKCVWVS